MRIRALWAVLLLCLSSDLLIAKNPEKASGQIQIRIFGKNLTTPTPQTVQFDPKICGDRRATSSVIQDQTGGLQNVVVWLEPLQNTPLPTFENLEPEIKIKNCEFVPRVSIVSPGANVKVKSEDDVLFQLRATGKKNARSSRSIPPNLNFVIFRMKESEIVTLIDDIHPWMRAFVVVSPHSFYQVTDLNGKTNLNNIPAGSYSLHFWHEILGSKLWPETIQISNKTLKLNYTWDFNEEPPK